MKSFKVNGESADVDAQVVDEFINFDDSVPTEETYGREWEKQIVYNFLNDKTQETNDDEDDSEEKDDSENTNLNDGSDLSDSDVLAMLGKLRNYASNKDSVYLKAVQDLHTLTEQRIVEKRLTLKQSSLASFFKPV